jgi:uroporphyrinogen-III decarboxylase
MPWVSRHLSKEEVRRFAESYNPSRLPELGILPTALAHTRYFRDRLKGLDIGIGEVNNQGPFDIAHQVRGEDLFYDLYDDPPFVHELMELCTTAYVDVYHLIEKAAGRTGRKDMPYCDDSSVLLSEPLFVEFSLPYLHKLAEHCGSIGIHYCGKGHLDQYYFDCPTVETINLGQPWLFDYTSYMERIVRAGKIYAGGWPPLPEESSAEEYLLRILAPLEKGRENLRFSIEGYECGKSSAELCRLWYTLQGAPSQAPRVDRRRARNA